MNFAGIPFSWRHENGSKGFEAKENRRGGGLMF